MSTGKNVVFLGLKKDSQCCPDSTYVIMNYLLITLLELSVSEVSVLITDNYGLLLLGGTIHSMMTVTP